MNTTYEFSSPEQYHPTQATKAAHHSDWSVLTPLASGTIGVMIGTLLSYFLGWL